LLVGLLILAVLAIPLFLALRRATELFTVQVLAGRARHLRGKIPRPLLHDIEDIVAKPRLASAQIRVVSEGGMPRVLVTGKISEAQHQRLRNVVGKYQVGQIRAGKRARRQ
jgi:hypothetical protein